MLANEIQKLLRQKCRVPGSTKLYRITDFFSVIDAIDSGRLKLTKVNRYSDQNEGVDRLVHGLVLSAWGPGCGYWGAHDQESANNLVARERASRFVSCWSRSIESHAMWGLYSLDHCSIRVQTTVDFLLRASALAIAENWSNFYTAPAGSPIRNGPLLCCADVLPVRYDDLHHLLARLSRRTRLARRIVKNRELSLTGSRKQHRTYDRWLALLEPAVLKDVAYAHEKEVRISLKFGWEKGVGTGVAFDRCLDMFNSATNGDATKLDSLLDLNRVVQPAEDAHLPAQYAAPLPSGFFENACIDPRAPKYKRDFMESEFRKRGMPVVHSSAFDRAFFGLGVFPDARPPLA